MVIGDIILRKTAALAPMAGVADRAFRELCKEYKAEYVVGEMASSKGMQYGSSKTAELMELGDFERPAAVQIFGDDPQIMARAAFMALDFYPDAIDINMGCPAPKIAGNGGGAALMKNPELAGRIIKAVVNAVPVPVTVKLRKGWDSQSVNAVELAKIAEQNGAAAITIHGRTREQMYSPPVDLEIIKAVKQAVKIPVIGNGDVNSIESAVKMYNETKCDLVMVGQGALGSPWIFEQLYQYFVNDIIFPEPDILTKMSIMCHHAKLACKYKSEGTAMCEMRKHAAWYMKGLNGAAGLRRVAGMLKTYADIEILAENAIKLNPPQPV